MLMFVANFMMLIVFPISLGYSIYNFTGSWAIGVAVGYVLFIHSVFLSGLMNSTQRIITLLHMILRK